MNPISCRCQILDYWRDFRRNRKQLSETYIFLNIMILFPMWFGNLFGFLVKEMFFVVVPLFFTAYSMGTHQDSFPPMFYLLPLSSSQKERYMKGMLAIRVFFPCLVTFLWGLIFACVNPSPCFSVLSIMTGTFWGCLFMAMSYGIGKKGFRTFLFCFGLILFCVHYALANQEDGLFGMAVILAVTLAVYLPVGLYGWKRFKMACKTRPNYEAAMPKKVKT